MYKELFKWVIMLIWQPGKAWEELAQKKEEENDDFLTRFVYPLIGLVTIAAFLGILFTRKEFDVELALKAAVRSLIAAFGGFYLSAWLLNEIMHGIYKREKDLKLAERFVVYSSALMLALSILLVLIPEFFFLRIFVLYTFYMVWEGAITYMGVDEKVRLQFVTIATLVILLIPVLLEAVLFLLMPGLRF